MNFELKVAVDASEDQAIADFVQGSSHAHVWQRPEALPIYLHGDRRAYRFIGRQAGAMVAYGTFYVDRHRREAVCFRGPVFDSLEVGERCLEALPAVFRRERVGQVRISPFWAGAEAHSLVKALEGRNWVSYIGRGKAFLRTGRVSLAEPMEEILKTFSKHTRSEFSRCTKAGFEVRRVSDDAESRSVYELTQSLKRRKDLTLTPEGQFQALFQRLQRDGRCGALLAAFKDGRLVGGVSLIKANAEVTIVGDYAVDSEFMQASYRSYRLGVPLWIGGMKWAQEAGCRWLDVEGYAEDTPRESELHAVHQFKSQFRPQPLEIVTEHATPAYRPKYFAYRVARLFHRLGSVRSKLKAGRLRLGL